MHELENFFCMSPPFKPVSLHCITPIDHAVSNVNYSSAIHLYTEFVKITRHEQIEYNATQMF